MDKNDMKKEETSPKKPRLSKEEAKQKRLDELKHTKNKTFFTAMRHALDGVIRAFKTERNLRIDYIIGLFVLLCSLFFDFSKTEFACLCLTIGFVIFAEMINSTVEYIEKIVKSVAENEELYFDEIAVSITSASKEEIKNINKEYREVDKVTDVLSFPIFTKDELNNLKKQEDEKKIKEVELGDIIICLDVVKVQAVEYGTGILRELLYMITHGMCHLVGYDHIKDDERKEMRALEEKVLNELGVEK